MTPETTATNPRRPLPLPLPVRLLLIALVGVVVVLGVRAVAGGDAAVIVLAATFMVAPFMRDRLSLLPSHEGTTLLGVIGVL